MTAATEYRIPAAQTPRKRGSLLWLITAAAISITLWQLPGGNYFLYPFTLLATWFHEMGHGLSALLLGGYFDNLKLAPNGSGLATHRGPLLLGNTGKALVAAGGPLGPPLAGAAFILAGRYYRSAHYSLLLLATALLISVLMWVRGGFGITVVSLMGVMVLLIALRTPPKAQTFTIQFLGVQACISTYQQIGYLFTENVAVTVEKQTVLSGNNQLVKHSVLQTIPSDTGQMAQYLALPYWFWGGLMATLSLIILVFSLRMAYTQQ